MINYHPSLAVLTAFSQAELTDSVSLIVASHVEMCELCQQTLNELTEKAANDIFESDSIEAVDDIQMGSSLSESSFFENIIDEITSCSDDISLIDEMKPTASAPDRFKNISHKDKSISLPRALNSLNATPWQEVGKISRARFQFDDDERRLSLLAIDKGGQIPQHTHKGIEITLLLEGNFEDDMGHYQKGDFIWLDGQHTHSPVTQEGCICLTLVSDALHFTQGFSKLLNPLGKLIY